MIENLKCDAATWCLALATPNTTRCRLHLKYPLLNTWESQRKWIQRVRREMSAATRAATTQAAADAKVAKRLA